MSGFRLQVEEVWWCVVVGRVNECGEVRGINTSKASVTVTRRRERSAFLECAQSSNVKQCERATTPRQTWFGSALIFVLRGNRRRKTQDIRSVVGSLNPAQREGGGHSVLVIRSEG
jgi:hypothetical protein